VVDADLEGIVAKKLADPYNPKLTRWHKILNHDSNVPDALNGSASVSRHDDKQMELVRRRRLAAGSTRIALVEVRHGSTGSWAATSQ